MLFMVTVRDVDKIFMGKESDALWYRIFHIGTGIIRGIVAWHDVVTHHMSCYNSRLNETANSS